MLGCHRKQSPVPANSLSSAVEMRALDHVENTVVESVSHRLSAGTDSSGRYSSSGRKSPVSNRPAMRLRRPLRTPPVNRILVATWQLPLSMTFGGNPRCTVVQQVTQDPDPASVSVSSE